MIAPILIGLRFLQYGSASILFGSALFLLFVLPRPEPGRGHELRWPLPLLGWSAAVLALASQAALLAQTAMMAGSWREGLSQASLSYVLLHLPIGWAAVFRGVAAFLVLLVFVARPPQRRRWMAACLFGALATASFAWSGHGAADEGSGGLIHLAADILHALAAGVWVGALVAFIGLLAAPRSKDPAAHRLTAGALAGFSAIGVTAVGLLLVTGLINSAFLIGLSGLAHLWSSPYGLVLTAKVALFAAMFVLASLNRFSLTPRLAAALADGDDIARAINRLKISLGIETMLGVSVLALVGWLGLLEPLSH